ncbi:MAG: sigma-70 family RNA polymerase sigma factor [Saprospiraceae bacterium]|nr:sigma-70 family RNA polymerase sigma factor [Saprospiraceae bacterium]
MEQQFKELIDRHNGILYKIARSYAPEREDMRDLYQEMLVQVWRALPDFRGESQASTWMYRIALNTALSYQQKQRRQQTVLRGDEYFPVVIDEGIGAAQAQQHRIDLLYRCISKLDKDERAIILLYLDEKSYEDMATILGISVNLVGVKIHRIKKKLQQLLLENEEWVNVWQEE